MVNSESFKYGDSRTFFMYASPLDSVLEWKKLLSEQNGSFLYYVGPLNTVLNSLGLTLTKKINGGYYGPRDYETFSCHPPRILRVVMDTLSTQSQQSCPSDSLLQTVYDMSRLLALRIYAEHDSHPSELRTAVSDYRHFLLDHHLLEQLYITEPSDTSTLLSSNPALTSASIDRLVQNSSSHDILFVPFGHGAYLAGIDGFLRYCEATESSQSIFYPIRFSSAKMKEQNPQLASFQRDELCKQADGKTVVLFDTDVVTGDTLIGASHFFEAENFFSSAKSTVCLVNYIDPDTKRKLNKTLPYRIL